MSTFASVEFILALSRYFELSLSSCRCSKSTRNIAPTLFTNMMSQIDSFLRIFSNQFAFPVEFFQCLRSFY